MPMFPYYSHAPVLPQHTVEIASSAARELRGLSTHWDSLSDLEQQERPYIVHLVRRCEQIILQFDTSSMIQVDKSEGLESNKDSSNTDCAADCMNERRKQ